MTYTAIFDADGKCLYVVDSDRSVSDDGPETYAVQIESKINPNDVFYDTDNARMAFKADFLPSISTSTIQNLPEGTQVTLSDGTSFLVDDGSIEFEVEFPETIHVILEHIRYRTKHVEVNCEAQD